MARETQGLQITLIVFVVLSIILAVTTYLFFRSYSEASDKERAERGRANQQEAAARRTQTEINALKTLMGFAITETPEAIQQAATADMQKYAANLTEGKQAYRTVLEYLGGVVQERNAQLADARAEILELQTRNETLEAVKEPQIKEHKGRAETAEKDLAAERSKYEADRKRLESDQAKVASDLETLRKTGEATLAKAQEQLTELDRRIREVIRRYNQVKTERDEMASETFERAQGEVRWVNQRGRNVYVNLGWADSLPRQTTFSVYNADTTDLTKAGKKGSIEITQIIGPHLAEARIVDDRPSNPMMPGDKINTPIWSPGAKKHFVLVGVMDVNGDGQDDRELVRNLIESGGGVVDAPLDASGKRTGEVTVNTRYVVWGKEPDPGKSPALTDDWSAMQKRAEELQIESIALGELLDQMGWKNEAPTLRAGAGGGVVNLGTVPAGGGVQQVSGAGGDTFRERQPPRALKFSF